MAFWAFGSLCHAQNTPQVKVRTLNSGQAFTGLTLDANGRLWAVTSKNGLWKSASDSASGDMSGLQRHSADESFNKYNLQTVTTSTSGGATQVWVGTNGLGTGLASGGGIYLFKEGEVKPKQYIAERDKVVAKGMGLPAAKNDGIPTRNCKAIAVDKYGSVWSAHGYHDLTITGSSSVNIEPYWPYNISVTGTKGGYYLTPGGVGMKAASNPLFNNVANDQLPYPAWTVNTPIEKSAGTRQCYSVGCGPNETWVGRATYPVSETESFFAGIARFDLNGRYIGTIDAQNTPGIPFTANFASPFPVSIHFRKNGDAWVGFNRNMGLSIYKDAIYTTARWVHVSALSHYNEETGSSGPSTLLPSGIRMNLDAPHNIASSGQRVYIGTQDGLLVYKGRGEYNQDSSYILVTTANGLSSNNIKGVAAGSKYVYVATDSGIDEIFIPGDVEVYHIKDKEKPNESVGGNYQPIATLTHKPDMQISFSNEDLPMVAADGSTSTVFRYYTTDFDGFYNSNRYAYGVGADYNQENPDLFGKCTLRPIASYENRDKSYVDIIYTHPKYIPAANLEGNESVLRFSIGDRTNLSTIFQHDIRIVLPPVLLVHGVWTDINSLNAIERALLANGYKAYQVFKAWRTNGTLEEKPFDLDKTVVPKYIKMLLARTTANGMSAGKVNVVVHSRGGLYTRAYIEGVGGEKYNDDVNSLITLNTPHAGSQLANLVADKRMIHYMVPDQYIGMGSGSVPVYSYRPDSIALGDIFKGFIPSTGDRINKFGASVLKVNCSLIRDLNEGTNLDNLVKHQVPIHVISTNAELCQLSFAACESRMLPMRRVARAALPLNLINLIVTDLPRGADAFLKVLFNRESNDIIVPKNSMEAGLSPQYITRFDRVAHIDMLNGLGLPGVAVSSEVTSRVVELLKQNMHDSQSNFTKGGLNPPRLTYDFLEGLSDKLKPEHITASGRLEAEPLPFFMERDSAHKKLKEGDTLKVKLHAEGFQKVLVVYEHEVEGDSVYMEGLEDVTTLQTLSFKIPKNYYGNMAVYAYGMADGTLQAIDTLHLTIGIDPARKLIALSFKGNELVRLLQQEKYDFTVIGLFDDSVSRVVNTFPGITYLTQDTAVVRVVDGNTIQGKGVGVTKFAVQQGTLVDYLEVTTETNPLLTSTVLMDFYVSQNPSGKPAIRWETYQEYQTKRFVLEKGNSATALDSVETLAGKGTLYAPSAYVITDEGFQTGTTVYYRLKIIDAAGKVTYSDVISYQDPEVLSLQDVTMEGYKLKLYPNPSQETSLQLELNAPQADGETVVIIYSLDNKEVHTQHVEIRQGNNVIPVNMRHELPAGTYIVKVKSSNFVRTSKWVLTE